MRSFTFNDTTFHFREPTVGDALDAEFILDAVCEEKNGWTRERYKAFEFANFVSVFDHADGELPFAIPAQDAPHEALLAAYEAWKHAPAGLLREWKEARRDTPGVTPKNEAQSK